jgi:hypothetical protein
MLLLYFLLLIFWIFLQVFCKKGFLYITAFTLMCNKLSKYQNSESFTGGSIATGGASLLGRSMRRSQTKKQRPLGYWGVWMGWQPIQ